jgi:selenocysteine-specific elongation factor
MQIPTGISDLNLIFNHNSNHFTNIGGAQIIDLMILVIDINKGIQTQTAECLVIGQITCDTMIVVINKIDLIPEAKREHLIEKVCFKDHWCKRNFNEGLV